MHTSSPDLLIRAHLGSCWRLSLSDSLFYVDDTERCARDGEGENKYDDGAMAELLLHQEFP